MWPKKADAVIELSIDNDVAHVVLNAPGKLNALDEASIGELDAAYQTAERAGVRALVLRGDRKSTRLNSSHSSPSRMPSSA